MTTPNEPDEKKGRWVKAEHIDQPHIPVFLDSGEHKGMLVGKAMGAQGTNGHINVLITFRPDLTENYDSFAKMVRTESFKFYEPSGESDERYSAGREEGAQEGQERSQHREG